MNNQIYAGFWIRFVASLIDSFLICLVMLIPYILLLLTGDSELVAIGTIIIYLLALVGSICYFVMMPLSRYQGTLGKHFLGLKIVDANGNKISVGKSWLRYFGYILSGIMYIGYIMVAFTEGKRGLHDLIANTYVVKSTAKRVEEMNSQSVV